MSSSTAPTFQLAVTLRHPHLVRPACAGIAGRDNRRHPSASAGGTPRRNTSIAPKDCSRILCRIGRRKDGGRVVVPYRESSNAAASCRRINPGFTLNRLILCSEYTLAKFQGKSDGARF